jgi:hypothetical protein
MSISATTTILSLAILVGGILWALAQPAALVVIGLLIRKKTAPWIPIILYCAALFRLIGAIPAILFNPVIRNNFGGPSIDLYSKLLLIFSIADTLATILFIAAVFGLALMIRKR